MVKKEYYRVRQDGVLLYRTYSDADLKIRKVGTNEIYDEAIDIEGAPFTYEETDKPIEVTTDLINADFISVGVEQ